MRILGGFEQILSAAVIASTALTRDSSIALRLISLSRQATLLPAKLITAVEPSSSAAQLPTVLPSQ